MPYDGNGTFSRLYSWVTDAAASIKIKSDRHDQNDDDIAAGLTNALTKDGQSQPTANIPMNGKKLTNLGAPTVDTDAANKAYVDALKTFSTGLEISGADVNGQLKFTSTTGKNGLSFTAADLSWLAKMADATATPPLLNRLVLNDKPDGTGNDVVTVNDNGTITATGISSVKGAAGNAHFWWYGPANEDRMVMYTAVASQGSGFVRIGGTQSFEFNTSGQFKAPGALYAGPALYNTDGNITGSIWANLGYNDAYTAIVNRIESRASAYAANKVGSTALQRVSLQYFGGPGGGGGWTSPGGTVIVGYNREGGNAGQVAGLYYMTLQIYDDKNGWRNMGG